MVVAISKFTVGASEANLLQVRFRHRSHRVDAHPGFIDLQVMRSSESEPTFLLVTRWISRDALREYLRSEDFRSVHANSKAETAEFVIYEVVAN